MFFLVQVLHFMKALFKSPLNTKAELNTLFRRVLLPVTSGIIISLMGAIPYAQLTLGRHFGTRPDPLPWDGHGPNEPFWDGIIAPLVFAGFSFCGYFPGMCKREHSF